MFDWLRRRLLLRGVKEVLKMEALKGYRTYLVLFAILALTAMEQFGGTDPAMLTGVKEWLYPLAIGFLRAGK
jgi:hypothetical protein